MSHTVDTHDYQCPCDMCEPEAHSVQELPPTRVAATLPPSSRADVEALAFEALVKKVGEGKARWSRLLALLDTEPVCPCGATRAHGHAKGCQAL